MIREHEHLDVLLLEDLQRGRLLHSVDGVAGHVVDALLALLHAVQVFVQAHLLVLGLRGEEAEELGELGAVGVILITTHLEILVEFLPELAPSRLIVLLVLLLLRLRFLLLLLTILLLLVVVIAGILLLRQLLHQLENLPHKLLRDHFHDLVLLELLAGHIQRQVVGVDHAPHEVEIARQQLVELLCNKDAAHEKLHLGLLLPVIVHHVEGCLLRQEEDRLELDLTLRVEVRVGKRVEVVLGDALVELIVLLFGDVLLGAQPDRLLRVNLLPLVDGLLCGRLLLLLFLLFLILLRLDIVLLLLVLLLIIIVLLFGLCLHFLLHLHVDGELDELGILLHRVLELVLGEVVVRILLEVERHTGAAAEGVATRIINDSE
mmetsp:Transcript_22146/g.45306  ORF Transcript_22146/g.45306 Transcript_22146/m.45306 type:complete len:376 (-) Transcript_22146:686-1813(-)